MRIFKKTDIGLKRSSNQDACDGGVFPDGAAWVLVCDGMGGANAGNIASSLALAIIAAEIARQYDAAMSEDDVGDMLMTALQEANQKIYEMAQQDDTLYGMGTTVVAGILRNGVAHIAHVGDSRAYYITKTGARQITVDHSMVQEMVDSGNLTPEEARFHPQKNIITRALGVREDVEPEYSRVEYGENDLILACTDGLSTYMDADDIFKLSQEFETQRLVDELVEVALQSGGSDNVTVMIAENKTA